MPGFLQLQEGGALLLQTGGQLLLAKDHPEPPQPSAMTGGSWVSMRQLRQRLEPPVVKPTDDEEDEAAAVMAMLWVARGHRRKVDERHREK